ncbi:hypothetical protein ACI3PL_32490, partial [Lacticaseibacillus paracasei]
FIIENGVTSPQTLDANETGVITSTGTLAVGGFGAAVEMTSLSLLTVAGTIVSSGNGVETASAGFVTVSAGGSVSSF